MSNTLVRVACWLGAYEALNSVVFCDTHGAETLLCTQVADWIDANVDFRVSACSLPDVVNTVMDHIVGEVPDGVREKTLINNPSWVTTQLETLPPRLLGMPPLGLTELLRDVTRIEDRLNNPEDPQPPTGDDYNELIAAVMKALKP